MSAADSMESIHSDGEEKFSDATDLPPEGMMETSISQLDEDKSIEDSLGAGEFIKNKKFGGEEVEEQSVQILQEEIRTRVIKINADDIKRKFLQTDDGKCHLCKYFYTVGNESLIMHAQEPWPKDVKLFQPYEIEQILLPDNANCLAVQAYLKMCNLDFQIESRPNAEYMSPSGKVPFIKCGAFVVAELEGIVAFVNQKGISLTEDLEPDQKSDLRAYMSLIDHVLGNAETYVCWCDVETYREVTKPRNGSVYPWPLNLIQTWSKRSREVKRLKTLGWYDKTLDEVFQEVETCCQALTDRLENNTYFFGNKFTELDALAYGHICTILTTCLPAGQNGLAFAVKKFDKLVRHCQLIDREIMGNKRDLEVNYWFASNQAHLLVNDQSGKGDDEFQESSSSSADIVDIEVSTESNLAETKGSGDEIKEKPTELDALVFGHLFTILTTPLPNLELANTVRKFPTLINLVKKVEKDFFKRETEH